MAKRKGTSQNGTRSTWARKGPLLPSRTELANTPTPPKNKAVLRPPMLQPPSNVAAPPILRLPPPKKNAPPPQPYCWRSPAAYLPELTDAAALLGLEGEALETAKQARV